jgi:predicted enzyme related to lactoylglutathione lyase
MIKGIHALFYTSEDQALREFFRDQVKLPYTDVGDGWLIFDVPEGDLGVHPIDEGGRPPAGTHAVSFYCDDIEATVADLKSRGVRFKGGIEDTGWGLVTNLIMPGGVEMQLYEPKYQKRARKAAGAKRAAPRKKRAPARKAAAKRRSR